MLSLLDVFLVTVLRLDPYLFSLPRVVCPGPLSSAKTLAIVSYVIVALKFHSGPVETGLGWSEMEK